MKKLSSLLVLMLIALIMFVSCNNNTAVKERPATPEDAEIFAALSSAATFYAFSPEEIEGVKRVHDGNVYTASFNNVKFTNPETKEVVAILNGTAKLVGTQESGTMILDLVNGTQYKGKAHTLYAKQTSSSKYPEIVIDGYKLTDLDKIQNNY
ncbi:MAG: hypothetical protein PUH25_07030 [Spirochaetales bacterium]|nr:hypothetical protein [Spirochaetales bacterium]